MIDRDIFHLPPESLLEAKVDATMVDGRFVYERAEIRCDSGGLVFSESQIRTVGYLIAAGRFLSNLKG